MDISIPQIRDVNFFSIRYFRGSQLSVASMKTILLCASLLVGLGQFYLRADSVLETGWQNPPTEARLKSYWWWLNGNVTKASITHDLEQMKAKGFGGAVLIDAGGADQWGNAQVPHGPTFFTPEWRELYKHALHEADRLQGWKSA